ncbi:MAG: hypothetical protein EXS08_07005 [Planctomycetes bacterium]|nr:hypothetical protein [Planctomycetota bacterium]
MRYRAVTLAACVLALSSATVAAQSYRLNDSLARATPSGVGSFLVTPDETRVVYTGDFTANGSGDQLYCAPTDGSAAPVLLATEAGGAILSFWIAAQNERVLFLRDQPNQRQLFSVPLDGGEPALLLNGPLVPGGTVPGYYLGREGLRLVFFADKQTNDVFELYSAPIDGSAAPIQLSGTMVAGGDVSGANISRDGTRAVYRADQDADGVFDLYGVPVGGSAPAVRLDRSFFNGDVQSDFQVSADGLGVIYRHDQDVHLNYGLFVARTDGSLAPVRRSAPLPISRRVVSYVLGADEDTLVYLADQDTLLVEELYRTSAVSGGTPFKLNAPLGGLEVDWFGLSPDSAWLVYTTRQSGQVLELLSVPTDGSAPARKLNAALQANNAILARVVTLDSQHVVYTEDRGFEPPFRLWTVPIDGSQPAVLIDASADYLTGLPQGSDLYYRRKRTGTDVLDVLRVPIDGGVSLRVNDELVSGGRVQTAAHLASGRVLYSAEQDHAQAFELYDVADTGGSSTKISGPLSLGALLGHVESFVVAPDGARAVYVAEQDSSEALELYSVLTDGLGGAVRLNTTFGTAEPEVTRLDISPDSTWVLALLEASASSSTLQAAPLDGSGPLQLLSSVPPGSSAVEVLDHALTADSSRVVFSYRATPGALHLAVRALDAGQPQLELVASLGAPENKLFFEVAADASFVAFIDQLTPGVSELFRVPLDGSLAPARLNGALVAAGDVGGDVLRGDQYPFALSPDSARVVYLADQDVNGVNELYGGPSDGSLAMLKLSGALVAGGDVQLDPGGEYRISPDSTRVVFRAERDVDGEIELFSAPLDGSLAPVQLNGALVAGGDVGAFCISPDATRVVYLADEEQDELFELFSAPLDGSAPRVKLNGALVAGGDVATLAAGGIALVLGSGGRVAFLADAAVDERYELFSAPLDGSAPALALNAALPPAGDVLDGFQLTPDGLDLVYAADPLLDERFELFLVALDGSRGPRRVSGPFVSLGGLVLAPPRFQMHPDGRRVLYLADQDTDGHAELYAGLFGRWARRASR